MKNKPFKTSNSRKCNKRQNKWGKRFKKSYANKSNPPENLKIDEMLEKNVQDSRRCTIT